MNKLDELVRVVWANYQGRQPEEAKECVRAYIEERFGPLMRQTEWDLGFESDAETLKAALARAKAE